MAAMELRHLRYFVAVGEALNFTKAATRLRVAQPALSRQVSDLEGEFGELQVGYLPPLDLEILPRALAAFQKTTPGVKVILHDLGSDDLCNELRNGFLQLALMIRPSEESSAGLEFEELRRCPFFVAMAPGHPLLRMKKIPVETLAAQPMVVLRRR